MRAKKPWYRARNIVLVALLVFCGVLGRMLFRAVNAKPGKVVDYWRVMDAAAAAGQPGTPEDPNGWATFEAAISTMSAVTDEARAAAGLASKTDVPQGWPGSFGFPFDFSAIGTLNPPEEVVRPTLDAIRTLRERGLEKRLDELAATKRIYPVYSTHRQGKEPLVNILLPELGSSRQLARYCKARMYIAGQMNDGPERVRAFEHGLVLARTNFAQPVIIGRLVGIAISSLMLGELRAQMSSTPLSAEEMRGLLGAIERQLATIPEAWRCLEGEKSFSLDMIQQLYSDDGNGDGTLLFSKSVSVSEMAGGVPDMGAGGVLSHPVFNVIGLLYPSKLEATAKTNEFFEGAIGDAKMPRQERLKRGFNADDYIEKLPKGYMVLKIMAPALGKVQQSNDQFESEVAGTRAMLAVEIYRAEHNGEAPASLEALVPSLLASVPLDPFSGKPMGYRRFAKGEDKLARAYLLYSVGLDGTDDAGTAGSSQWAPLTPQGKGTDFIFNAPRE